MHTTPNIPPSDLLLAYLAGELNDVQETMLFRRLSESTELRMELRDYVVIDSLVRRDADTIMLPAQLKSSTMSAVATSGRQKTPTAIWTLPRVFGLAVISAFLGSILALVLTYQVQKQEQPETTTLAATSTKAPEQNTGRTAQIHSASATAIATDTLPAQSSRRRSRKQNAMHQPSAPVLAATSQDEEKLERAHLLSAKDDSYNIQSASPIAALSLHTTSLQSAFALPDLPSGFRVDIRGTAMHGLQQTDVPSQSDPWFNNMSVGVAYALSEHHSLGVEIGQEAFTQLYSGTENGRSAAFEQQPLLLWMGGSYQYTSDGIDPANTIRPFGRIIAGGTATGPITRGIAGIQYTPDTRVSLWLGAEGSLLLYRFQNTWFSSHKIGMSYGMSIQW